MPVALAKRQEILAGIRKAALDDVANDHQRAAQTFAGTVRNQGLGFWASSKARKLGALSSVLVAPLKLVPLPLLMPAISAAAKVALKKAGDKLVQRNLDQSADPFRIGNWTDEHLKAASEQIAATGAPSLRDAVRKVDEAEKELGASSVMNCGEFKARMHARARYAYRVQRLEAYLEVMRHYVEEVQQHLERHKQNCAANERQTDVEGLKLFDSWQWHTHCRDSTVCYYPFDELGRDDISSPTPSPATLETIRSKLAPPVPPKSAKPALGPTASRPTTMPVPPKPTPSPRIGPPGLPTGPKPPPRVR